MNSKKFSFTLIVILLFILCSSCDGIKNSNREKAKPKFESLEEKDIAKSLSEINSIMERAALEGDFDTILKYYTDDVVLLPAFKPALKGIAAVKESYDKNKKEGTKYHSFDATTEKIWLCDNQIFQYGTYGFSVSTNETKHPYAFNGSFITIWEKQADSSYLIKFTMSNLDFNPCDYYN